MGVKFAREYNDIVADLVEAIKEVQEFYRFFEMSGDDWADLNQGEQKECVKTLADDIFYALGNDQHMPLGKGSVHYDKAKHIIKIDHGDKLVTIVNLI